MLVDLTIGQLCASRRIMVFRRNLPYQSMKRDGKIRRRGGLAICILVVLAKFNIPFCAVVFHCSPDARGGRAASLSSRAKFAGSLTWTPVAMAFGSHPPELLNSK